MTTSDFTPLHTTYVHITHRPVRYDMGKFFRWEAWANRGWTEADLKLVVAYIWHRIRQGKRFEESFRFKNLIEDQDRFEEDLVDARAWARQSQQEPGVPARVRVLSATGRTQAVVDTSRSAASVMREHQTMAKLLKEYREQL
jgi:hypothetical protein